MTPITMHSEARTSICWPGRPVARYVSYNALGSTRLVSGALQAGTFTVCTVQPGSGTESRQVVLAVTGRVRLQSGAAGVCP